MVESDARPPRAAVGGDPMEWQLAPGVWLVEGTAVGTNHDRGQHVYTLVRPDGRRFQVSEALYRLAQALEQRQSLTEIAAHMGAYLARPLSAPDVTKLIHQKLVPWGVATLR